MAGAATGFRYSLIGGGDRLSAARAGRRRQRTDQRWLQRQLGSRRRRGRESHRAVGQFRALAECDSLRSRQRSARSRRAALRCVALLSIGRQPQRTPWNFRILLDPDFNPYNGNEIEIDQRPLPNTGTSARRVHHARTAASIRPASRPARYALCARISDGVRSAISLRARVAGHQPRACKPPAMDCRVRSLAIAAARCVSTSIAFPGQNVTIHGDNRFCPTGCRCRRTLFTGNSWEFVDVDAGKFTRRFYRAVTGAVSRPLFRRRR